MDENSATKASPASAFGAPGLIRRLANLGLHAYAKRRVAKLERCNPAIVQEQVLQKLVRTAAHTRFGRDHGFDEIGTPEQFQSAVPIRTYEDVWKLYFQNAYPEFRDLTWPGLIPFLR